MNNTQHFVRILSSFIVIVLMFAQDQAGQNKGRDLGLYDKAGPFIVGQGKAGEHPGEDLAAIREFLWEHWHKQRLGHLAATFYSKEGEASVHSFFVEPDVANHWIVLVETHSKRYSRRPESKRFWRENRRSSYNVLERIEPLKDGMTSPVTIPGQKARQPETYWLRLKNKRTGEQLTL